MLTGAGKGGEIDMAVLIADGMVNGLCENCPVCKNATLTQCSGRIVCWGYVSPQAVCGCASDSWGGVLTVYLR